MGAIFSIRVRTIFAELRRRARKTLGLPQTQCGGVTFVQRFNSALALNLQSN
jgi:hypothetical protein